VRPYFGDGDEFHMAFHFPLMPRLFMGVRSEDRQPIIDMFKHTPEIPPACQWCLFLRNHDELTLEMCTGEERDYMYYAYARDPQMRRNIGIARRLAPLLDNDRRKVELLNSIVFTLPGSPIIYYGDEIGMGDNIHLGDRNGVRTPMHWTADRNAGFSKADPSLLFLPVVADPVYGYQAVNIDAQKQATHSLLNWMRRMIAIRKKHQVFGRGTLQFLSPANEKILAYLRVYEQETLLLVHNLAGSSQAVELDLTPFKDVVPEELLGESRFPAIHERPYILTLGPYSSYWLHLPAARQASSAYSMEWSAI
jgi:maltose alpha-D-glucosyltransferase/alpha-amylase